MSPDRNYYDLLGVSQTADAKILRKAFHSLSKDLHPDTTSLPVDEAAQKFRKVCAAYEVLSDSFLREEYDKQLKNKINKVKNIDLELNSQISSNSRSGFKQDSRRDLSGGELFSLLLLCIALLISVTLGIGFALLDGRELQVTPSWLLVNHPLNLVTSIRIKNDSTAFIRHSFKSTFFIGA